MSGWLSSERSPAADVRFVPNDTHSTWSYDLWSHSPEFNALVDELRTASREFARWWKAHRIRPKPSGTKLMVHHPSYGRVTVAYSTFQSNENPDLRLVLYGAVTPVSSR